MNFLRNVHTKIPNKIWDLDRGFFLHVPISFFTCVYRFSECVIITGIYHPRRAFPCLVVPSLANLITWPISSRGTCQLISRVAMSSLSLRSIRHGGYSSRLPNDLLKLCRRCGVIFTIDQRWNLDQLFFTFIFHLLQARRLAMRLFLLPISTKRSLLYCQRTNKQLNNEQSYAARITAQVSKKRINKQPQVEQSYIDRLTSKASKTWLSWGKADKGWRKLVTSYGEKLLQRLPYEEWGLKSIPPLSTKRKTEKLGQDQKTLLVYPRSVITHNSAQEIVRSFATKERQEFHKKWMLASFLGMPIVAPIALIPVWEKSGLWQQSFIPMI